MRESPSQSPSGPLKESPSLIMIQFLAWVGDRPRTYTQAMEAWRSTCPRLSVWEDAIIEGLVKIENGADRAVTLTPRGRGVLEKQQYAASSADGSTRIAAE
jgi:hypothetical protein